MHHHAPNPAAQPHLSLNAFSVPFLSREERNGNGERPSFHRTIASGNEPWFGATSAAETREDDFDTEGFIRLVSRPLLGVTLRGYPAPGVTRCLFFNPDPNPMYIQKNQASESFDTGRHIE